MSFYKPSLDFMRIFENNTRHLDRCTERESIDHNIELILTTSPGEHKFDPEYGCRIWDLDFEKIYSKSKWEDYYVEYIQEAVSKYEPRVGDVMPRVYFSDFRVENKQSNSVSIRHKVDIHIDLIILSTKTKCCYYYSLFMGPLSSSQ